MKNSSHLNNEEMKFYFSKKIKEIGRWPYEAEDISLERLPINVTDNTTQPEMPWHAEANDNYLEFRRLPFWSVSGHVFMGLILSLLSMCFLTITITLTLSFGFDVDLFFLYMLSTFFGVCILPGAAKMAFFTPHYLPVRFNRKTQKVYVSDVIIDGNMFFGKIKVTCYEMDWKDVEAWSVSRVFSKNMPYFGLHLVENTSNDVNLLRQTRMYTTRSPWSNEEMERQRSYIPKIWSYCQHYMAFNPVPDESIKPKPFVFLKNNWRFKWPDEMDERSRNCGDAI